jgi:hypothetical protein
MIVADRRTSYIRRVDNHVHFELDQYADCSSIILLKQQSAGRHVTPLGHTIILIRNQPVFVFTP